MSLPVIFLAIVLGFFSWSAVKPHDYFTWVLEAGPAFIGGFILFVTYKRFRFTNLLYGLIALHAIVLIIGAHYTYAEVPLFNWLRDTYHLARNHYDRLGHFMQGFVPAMIAREILLRLNVVKSNGWRFFIITCICLAISAFYELIEWWVAVAAGSTATDFLGSQGDPWDAQWDMFCALIGALCAQLALGKFHDRQLQKRKITVKI